MPRDGFSPGNKAFGEGAGSQTLVAYESHQDALRFLTQSLDQRNRIALLQGPTGSGKTTIVHELASVARRKAAAALVDAARLSPHGFLTGVLGQFEVPVVSQQDEQLLQAIDNFVSRESRAGRAPLLIVDNADRATPSIVSLVNWLAALEAGDDYAIRIVLTGREAMAELARKDTLRSVGRRHPATWSLNPLSAYEARLYLRTRYASAGGSEADAKFTDEICDRLHELAEGWPGSLNRQALAAMDRADELEAAEAPRLIVTRDGETIAEHRLMQKKYVIGRSELADIIVDDGYASKLHAMLQVYSNAVLLSDLNSTNGTIVNAKEVRNTLLKSNDVIMLGKHRLKIENAPALAPDVAQRLDAGDTMTMQTLEDLRRARARRNIAAIRHRQAG